MEEYLRNYIVALPVFVILDFTWIGILMKKLYLGELASLARTRNGKFTPNIPASILAWAIIPAGLVIFAVPRLSPGSDVVSVLGWGALFGFITYGMYDLTNLATVQNYTTKLTIVDTLWGTTLSAFVTLVVWLVAK